MSAGAGALKLTGRARLAVDTVAENRLTRNVIADQPGRALRVAMVGAHLDSVREGPGINDNGSGVAVTLALAERLRNQRGLRFGFWGGEARVYGSRRYVASLSPAERRRITGYLNLDMLGSPNAVRYLYGAGRVRDALVKALRARKLRYETISIGGSSDHAPFADAGISAAGLYSGSEERRPRARRACSAVAPGGRSTPAPPALRCAQPGRPRRDDRARRGRRPGAAGARRVTPRPGGGGWPSWSPPRSRWWSASRSAPATTTRSRAPPPRARARPDAAAREGGAQALAPPPGRPARSHALRRLRPPAYVPQARRRAAPRA